MTRYDVFLANALADREMAELIVRRLRALKFKVRYDKKREHTTPTPKDYRDADAAQSVLILWSKESCNTESRDSDWVHAIAHHARSKDGVLVQAGLDASVPDEPFRDDTRFAVSGMGPRKLVTGYYDLVEELGRRDGRVDLRDWIDLKASDKNGKEIWKENHPADPLSQAPKPKKPRKPQAAAIPAATPVSAAPAAVSPDFAANLDAPAAAASAAIEDRLGPIMLMTVGAAILGMLLLSGALRSSAIDAPPTTADGTTLVEKCPAGQIPAYLLNQGVRQPLEPGPIIDDTEDE